MNSDTPLTDAHVNSWDAPPIARVDAVFARELERGLRASQDRVKELERDAERLINANDFLLSRVEVVRNRVFELEAWKEGAMKVMAPFQDIGREMGLKLGEPIHDRILPFIRELKAKVQALGGEP